MKRKKQCVMRISDDTHEQLRAIKKHMDRSMGWIAARAIKNYFKATVGNTIAKE